MRTRLGMILSKLTPHILIIHTWHHLIRRSHKVACTSDSVACVNIPSSVYFMCDLLKCVEARAANLSKWIIAVDGCARPLIVLAIIVSQCHTFWGPNLIILQWAISVQSALTACAAVRVYYYGRGNSSMEATFSSTELSRVLFLLLFVSSVRHLFVCLCFFLTSCVLQLYGGLLFVKVYCTAIVLAQPPILGKRRNGLGGLKMS